MTNGLTWTPQLRVARERECTCAPSQMATLRGQTRSKNVLWHQWVVPNGTWDTAHGTAILPALCDSGTVEEIMGCLFAVFAGFFPRLAVLFIWIARPQLF